MYDNLIELSFRKLKQYGIDPLYFVTIAMLILVASYIREIKNWKDIPSFRRHWIIGTTLSTIVIVIMSILQLLGFF